MMLYVKQPGFTVSATLNPTVKLVPATRAVMAGGAARNPVLHVTLSAVPSD